MAVTHSVAPTSEQGQARTSASACQLLLQSSCFSCSCALSHRDISRYNSSSKAFSTELHGGRSEGGPSYLPRNAPHTSLLPARSPSAAADKTPPRCSRPCPHLQGCPPQPPSSQPPCERPGCQSWPVRDTAGLSEISAITQRLLDSICTARTCFSSKFKILSVYTGLAHP